MSMIKTNSGYSCRRSQQGFSLLEALIGFMILAIGMLGIASLQAVSLQAGKTSIYGSVAVMKIEELLESMRSNPGALASYTGAGVDNACGGTKECTPAEQAQDDVYWWTQNLSAGLPSSVSTVVSVTAPVAPSKMAEVSVQINWKERNSKIGGAESVDKSYGVTASICTAVPC